MNKTPTAIFIALLITQMACAKAPPSQAPLATQSNASPSPAKYYKNLKAQAEQVRDAVLRGDYARAADLTYPKLVELLGGRAKYMATLEQGMKKTQSEGLRVISDSVDEPEDVIDVENQLYGIVPTTMKIKGTEGVLVKESFMIGISNDRGENWTFVGGGNGLDKNLLKTLFPSAADKLRIPETKRPVLEREP